jgi:hypothetical protein
MSASTAAVAATNSSPARVVGYDNAIEKYVSFLKKQKQTPVDYILGLFSQNDMVILCERSHPEVTQYDMIYAVVSDPRFQQQAGHIFTEVGGSAALRPYIETFLMDDQLSNEQVNERLRYIARNIGWLIFWEKTNFYDFLRRLYHLNRTLPKDRRVHVYPSDLDFRWENATKESYAEFKRTQLHQRDKLMAENIINRFNAIRQAGSRNKALVIMNYRHAFPHLKLDNGGNAENTGGFLMQAYPGKVANVMINTVAPLRGSNDQQEYVTAMQGGKWDAAFAVVGNPDVGFDFNGSPLGEDGFDYYPYFPTHLGYQDVFTGFVFFKPLDAHRMSMGFPAGLLNKPFADEVLKRARSIGADVSSDATSEKVEEELGTVHISGYENKDIFSQSDCSEKIQQWLKMKP